MTQISSVKNASDLSKRTESLVNKFDIPIDHLDFAYVKSCSNGKELEQILQILRSGEEGYFPDLIKCVEQRLHAVKPKSKLLRTAVRVLSKEDMSKSEWNKLSIDMQDWIESMQKNDKELNTFREIKTTPGEVPIRKSSKCIEKCEVTKTTRIKSMDYESWNKLDVDAEMLKMDLAQEKIKEDVIRKQKAKEQLNTVVIDPDIMTEIELEHAALEAKNRGNEAYRLGDYEDAMRYYSDSISLMPLATTYNNRAMTSIKLEKYYDAMSDCNEVLKQEPYNEKALYRKALALHSLQRHDKALQYLERLIQINPSNTVGQNLMKSITSKMGYAKTTRSVRMRIQEEKSEYRHVDVVIPIPGTSRSPGPYYKVLSVPENIADKIATTTKPTLKNNATVIDLSRSDSGSKAEGNSVKNGVITLQSDYDRSITQLENSKLEKAKTDAANTRQTSAIKQETDKLKCVEEKQNVSETEGMKREETMRKDESFNGGVDDVLSTGEPQYPFEIEYHPWMFVTYLQSLKNDRNYVGHEKLLRLVNPVYLPTGCKLDNEMLTAILECLNKRFCNVEDAELIKTFLTYLIKVPRVNILLSFMSNQEKNALQNLLAVMKKCGFECQDVYDKYSEFI